MLVADVPTTKPGSAVAPPLAQEPLAGASGVAPVEIRAASPAKFGGNPSGRKLSVFKHPPGTPEGIEERRKADAERKKAEREASAKMVEPPPLPSAGTPLDRQSFAPAGGVGPVPVGSSPVPEAPPVLWQPDLLAGLVNQLLKSAEENRVARFVARCKQAGILGELLREIERDAHFPQAAVVLLKDSLPRLACKWLNKFGVSAEFRDELQCVTAILLIVKNDKATASRLDELLALKRAEDRKADKPKEPETVGESKPLEVGR